MTKRAKVGTYRRRMQVNIHTTLIVVPANLRHQWIQEIAKHVERNALTWYALAAS